MPTDGAVVSIWIACVLVASTFPSLSHERYFTVVAADTTNAPLYVGLESVGSDPFVV